MQPFAKAGQRRSALPSRARAKDGEDCRKVVDAFDRKLCRAARAQTSEKRRIGGDFGWWPHRRMSYGLGVDALRADLLEITCSDKPHQSARDLTVVRIRRTAKRFPGVPILTARNALPKAKLEPIQISFRVVRHVTVLRIDSGWGSPQTGPQLPPQTCPYPTSITLTATDALSGSGLGPRAPGGAN